MTPKRPFICTVFNYLAVVLVIIGIAFLLFALIINYGGIVIDKVLHFLSHLKEYLDTYINQ